MLFSFKDLRGFRVRAIEKPEGSVDDIYFDDGSWTVRYLVAGIGFWIFGRQCLVGQELLGTPDVASREFPVKLTAEQLKEDAPDKESDRPVSDQQRVASSASAAWPPYLIGAAGGVYTPLLAERQIVDVTSPAKAGEPNETGDPNLRSMGEVAGYDVAASDGSIGSITDFLVDPADWRVRYVVVDTGNWLPGKKVVVASEWASYVDWPERKMGLDVTKDRVESSPDLENIKNLKRSDEARLFEHYGTTPYWTL